MSVVPSLAPSSPDPVLDEARALLTELNPDISGRDLGVCEVVVALAGASGYVRRQKNLGCLSSDSAFHMTETAAVLPRLLRIRQRSAPSSVPLRLNNVLEQTAEMLCFEMGFERVMTFTVGQGQLDIASSVFVQDNEWAQEMAEHARKAPPRMDFAVLESAVVDGQRCVVVEDPQNDSRTWKPVIEPLETQGYVSAPIVVDGQTIATLHADRWFSGRSVEEHDRDMLGLAAAEASRIVGYSLAENPTRAMSLSLRQIEVLEQVATGASNAQIAQALFISAETVKSHLKRIYGILGAANRVQAVTHYRELS